MTDNVKKCYPFPVGISLFITGFSITIFLSTVIASVFAVRSYNEICICTVNFLAYGWISFLITVLLSFVLLMYCTVKAEADIHNSKNRFIPLFLGLQFLGFMAGLIFTVIFITRYINVL